MTPLSQKCHDIPQFEGCLGGGWSSGGIAEGDDEGSTRNRIKFVSVGYPRKNS